jgi:Spy/CpxP family protein refolding chaperone
MEEQNGKRRFLRGGILAAVIGSLAAGLGGYAWAHGGGPGGHGGWHRGGGFMRGPMDEQRIERMVKHMAVEIDATPDQTAKLTEIAKAAAKDLRPLREKARDARREGMKLLAAPTIDRGAIERLRAEQIQAADAASKRLTQALADTAEVLTPAQRQKLAERFQRRGPHRGPQRQRG